MIHIDPDLLREFAIIRLFDNHQTFASFHNNVVYHSPDSRDKSVPADEVYGGPPAPYDVTVTECWCQETNLLTGYRREVGLSKYNLIMDGPGFMQTLFGSNQFVGNSFRRTGKADNKLEFDCLTPAAEAIFRALVYDPDTNCYRYDESVKLPPKFRIIDKNKPVAYSDYKWSPPIFLYDGDSCNFEKFLQHGLETR